MSEIRPAFNFFTPLRFGVLLALLIFATFPQVILGIQTFVVRDYAFFSYPLAYFQKNCFWRGEIPFWNPYNNCGIPFLAQWNTMPLYPPALIYLLLPLNWSLSFFCLLHLWFAGLGMYFLARRWTQNNFAAAFAGTVFSFNGLTLNLLMWPSHIATLSWMPWVVLAVEMAWRDGGRKIIFAALAGTMQMLAGGPETIFLTWLLLLALWIQQLIRAGSLRREMFLRFPMIVLLVIALAAIQLFPFLDLVAHSQRETGYADLRWSLPAWGFANFFVPMAFGSTDDVGVFSQTGQSWTSSYYFGFATLWLALLACWIRDARVKILIAAGICSLIFAFGKNTFIYPTLRKVLPQLSFITYPVKFLLLLTIVLPPLAAFGLAKLQNISADQIKLVRWHVRFIGAILTILLATVLFWVWRFPFPGDASSMLWNGFSRVPFLILTGVLLCLILSHFAKGVSPYAMFISLVFVEWLDVWTHEPNQNPSVDPFVYTPGLSREKLAMQPQPELGESRAMSTPSAFWNLVHQVIRDPKNHFLMKQLGYCGDGNLLDATPKVDGFFSLYPRECGAMNDVLYGAMNADYPRLEDFMGVSQITTTNFYSWQARKTFLPLVTAGQKPVFMDDTNMLAALTQPEFDGAKIVLLPPETKSSIAISNQTNARILNSPRFQNERVDIDAEANEPSLVVIAQTYYHNWHALVDGKPAPLLRANYAFQAVQVPAGKHHIEIFYKDIAFEMGGAISLLALLGCLIAPLFLKNCEQFDNNFSSTKNSPRC